MRPTRKQTDEYLDRIRGLVDQYGWAIQSVFPDKTDQDPGFAYTVGLSLHGHAELIISGLPPATGQTILNDLAKRVRDSGQDLTTNTPMDDVIENLSVILIPVTDPGNYVTVADTLLHEKVRGASAAAVQMVWPDQHGRFPWETDCTTTAAHQKILGPAPTFG